MTVHQEWENAKPVAVTPAVAPDLAWTAARVFPEPRRPLPPSKRIFDIAFSLVLLIPLGIVMTLVALLLLLIQGRPIFYAARRMRSPNSSFTQLKFRTMVDQEDDSGATGGHKHWRITPFGHFLRRSRIDELPQLFNILKGDMSFVGPRPPLREYVERFPDVYARVLKNRPGVTGLATLIYHRHEDKLLAACTSAEETEKAYYRRCLPAKLKIDLIYQRHRSLAMDLWILWHTIKIVVSRRDERPRRRGRRT